MDPESLIKAVLTQRFPTVWGSRVSVNFINGASVAAETLVPAGAASAPLDWRGIERKYQRLGSASGLDVASRLEALRAGCSDFETESSGHCESLLRLVMQGAASRRQAPKGLSA